MLYSIVSYEADGDVVDTDSNDVVQITGSSNKTNVLKGKVIAVTKLMRMYKVLKENQDNIVKLKQMGPSGTLPSGVLAGGAKSIERAISSFSNAKAADKVNEALPGHVVSPAASPKVKQLHYKHIAMGDEEKLLGSADDNKIKA